MPFQFAADFTEKTLFKTIMVRLLKAALQNEKENFTSLLTEEILNVDNQLLQVERATNEVSGKGFSIPPYPYPVTHAQMGQSRSVRECFRLCHLSMYHFVHWLTAKTLRNITAWNKM